MIGQLLGEFSKFANKYDDDLVDRCNHRYTVIILSTFITIIATKQYFGDPIVYLNLVVFFLLFLIIILNLRFVGHQHILLVRTHLMQILFVSLFYFKLRKKFKVFFFDFEAGLMVHIQLKQINYIIQLIVIRFYHIISGYHSYFYFRYFAFAYQI